jgi:hypothetical protein
MAEVTAKNSKWSSIAANVLHMYSSSVHVKLVTPTNALGRRTKYIIVMKLIAPGMLTVCGYRVNISLKEIAKEGLIY